MVIRPRGVKILTSRWICLTKVGKNNYVIYKARVVVRGFQDENNYELRESYVPIFGVSLVRACLSIINKEDLETRQSDGKTAFLNGKLEVPIYMKITDGNECSKNKSLATREISLWFRNKSKKMVLSILN